MSTWPLLVLFIHFTTSIIPAWLMHRLSFKLSFLSVFFLCGIYHQKFVFWHAIKHTQNQETWLQYSLSKPKSGARSSEPSYIYYLSVHTILVFYGRPISFHWMVDQINAACVITERGSVQYWAITIDWLGCGHIRSCGLRARRRWTKMHAQRSVRFRLWPFAPWVL